MSDAEPPVTPPPAAPPSGAPVPPPPGSRSTPKLVVGIVLTVIGGLFTLGGLARFAANVGAASNGAEAAGRVAGGLLIWVVLLVVGIVLIATSRRK